MGVFGLSAGRRRCIAKEHQQALNGDQNPSDLPGLNENPRPGAWMPAPGPGECAQSGQAKANCQIACTHCAVSQTHERHLNDKIFLPVHKPGKHGDEEQCDLGIERCDAPGVPHWKIRVRRMKPSGPAERHLGSKTKQERTSRDVQHTDRGRPDSHERCQRTHRDQGLEQIARADASQQGAQRSCAAPRAMVNHRQHRGPGGQDDVHADGQESTPVDLKRSVQDSPSLSQRVNTVVAELDRPPCSEFYRMLPPSVASGLGDQRRATLVLRERTRHPDVSG